MEILLLRHTLFKQLAIRLTWSVSNPQPAEKVAANQFVGAAINDTLFCCIHCGTPACAGHDDVVIFFTSGGTGVISVSAPRACHVQRARLRRFRRNPDSHRHHLPLQSFWLSTPQFCYRGYARHRVGSLIMLNDARAYLVQC